MKLRIRHKLFLAMLATTGLGIAFMALSQRYTFERGLLNYAQEVEFGRLQVLVDDLEERYGEEKSWAFIAGSEQWPAEFLRFARRDRRSPRGDIAILRGVGGNSTVRSLRDGGNQRDLAPRPIPRLWERISLLDAQQQWIAGIAVPDNGARRELNSNGAVVGYLMLAPLEHLSDELDLEFARQQLQAVVWAAVIVLIGTALAAALLARSFGAPIRALTRGTHALATGRYDTRLDPSRGDELGQLATDFNSLASALQQTQQARQQWVADISHELRTPITVLQAELELLEDGLRPLNGVALQSLSAEVKRLRLLVDDLHQLAQSDSGALTFERTPVDVMVLLNETVARFGERASAGKLSLEFHRQTLPPVLGDADRLRQLFDNLMENSLRYTDPGGTVRLAATVSDDHIRITIEDSLPGVPDEALPQLFDRLYRVEPSRSRETGASGLGLAICESIVIAHGGTIRAAHSELGGLIVNVDLPVDKSVE
tara:strand:- start:2589 stop:4043 length:1455 start_codon:yes stop_codon:yes gene_type:complete